jgi:hypothetical protein
MIEKTIIEQLDNMAKVALKPEDMERWNRTKDELMYRLTTNPMQVAATGSYFQLRQYDGTDFQFKKTQPLHQPGKIAAFKLGDMTPSIPAFINARHEYSGKWKYDIIIAVKLQDAWHTTRLYNIEEKWLTPEQ